MCRSAQWHQVIHRIVGRLTSEVGEQRRGRTYDSRHRITVRDCPLAPCALLIRPHTDGFDDDRLAPNGLQLFGYDACQYVGQPPADAGR